MNKYVVLVFVVYATWQVDAGLLFPDIARNITTGVKHGAEKVIQGARDILPWHSHKETPAVVPVPEFDQTMNNKQPIFGQVAPNLYPSSPVPSPVLPQQYPQPALPIKPPQNVYPTQAPAEVNPTQAPSNVYPAPNLANLANLPKVQGIPDNKTSIGAIARCGPTERYIKSLGRCAEMED